MSENKRLIAVGLTILLVISLILVITFWPKPDTNFVCGIKADGNYKRLGAINYKQYQCLVKEKGKEALVVTNSLSKKEKQNLNNVAKSIGKSIYYLNTQSINKDDLKTIKKDLKYNDSSFKKDVILVIEKGKVDSYKEDVLSNKDELKSFLKEAGLARFACDATPSEEYENLGELTYEKYKCLYESEEPFAVIFSQTTCSYCMQFKPVINEYVGKNNIPLYFIEINTLSDEEREGLLGSLSYFDDNESWGTPLTLGIKNKEVVTEISGFTDDEEEIDNFFEKMELK